MHNPNRLLIPIALGVAALAAVLLLGIPGAGAAATLVGCAPGTLTVRTGQQFYFTIVVSDVVDLYAWQTDVTYNPTYLEYDGLVMGDMLAQDGAAVFSIPPTVDSVSGELNHAAATRLGSQVGVDGSGTIFYLQFTALADTGTGSSSAQLSETKLADRNALPLDRAYIASGRCQAIIDDDAPPLIQPPLNYTVFLPHVRRP